MSDITMCVDDECKARQRCYRFTAVPNDLYQSYFVEAPDKDTYGACEYFIPNDVSGEFYEEV